MFDIDPREGSTQLTLTNLKFGVCAEMEGHCPESFTQLLLSSIANGAMTFAGSRDGGGIRAGGRRGDTSPCHSFLPGTEVALADGEKKNIEDVTTGDKVVATDPETGKTTTRPVVATIVTKDDKHFTDLSIKPPPAKQASSPPPPTPSGPSPRRNGSTPATCVPALNSVRRRVPSRRSPPPATSTNSSAPMT
ncbi:Hint domain-containing protein [Streptomyces platensis]|uniref:Hint domain-containing protein n=1 Tax=Streptomyces platensis TaxID=58346 RepID=UPI0036C09F87